MEIKTVARLGRLKDITVSLLRYGFDDVVERLDFPGKSLLEKIHPLEPELSTWERIRRLLEDLGPAFIKVGQVMSVRPDLLPMELIVELRKLQDEVSPVSLETVRQVVEQELGRPVEEIFARFEPTPLAAASLSQVHAAVCRRDGREVAVKVQRPGIQQLVANDLYLAEIVAGQLHERMETLRPYELPSLVREVKRTLLRELDFTREARHMRISRANLETFSGVYIPEVITDLTTPRVLTMELVRGAKLSQLAPEDVAERRLLARRGLRLTVKQILEDGFFHADPHPGNILILPQQVLCVLDWGMVGRLTRRIRFEIIDLINAVVDRDSEALLNVILRIASNSEPGDKRRLERDLLDIVDLYQGVPIGELNVGQLLLDVTSILREYRLRLPVDMAIMIKALLTAEGTARELYPQLNVVAEAEPFVRGLARERWRPAEIWRGLRRTGADLLMLQRQLPLRLGQILDKVEQGELNVRLSHQNLSGLRSTLENISNRLTLGIIIGALIIGSSMIITTGVEPLLLGFPALGIIGYIASGILGLWLIFNIIRSRKF